MAAPGVVVSTATRSGPTGTVRAPSGQYFVAGIAERGPVDAPQKINSMGDYRRIFGDRVSYGTLFDDLAMFFETGGAQAQVLRVVGAAATVGTLSVNDGAGTPVPTVRFDAASPGAWSSRVTVDINAGTNDAANSRGVVIRLDGQIVEAYDNLASVAEIVTKFAKSPYVRATDLGSATVAPGNLPAPNSPTALTAGTDDRAAVNAARIATQLPLLKVGLGDGAVAVPGFGQAIHAALLEHARTHRRVALLSAARATSADDLITMSLATLGPAAGAEYGGLFGPWVQVSDGAGGVRTISPEGFVAAARNRAHEMYGAWAPAAGELSVNSYIVGIDQEFSRADHERLDAARVNPIRLIAGRIRLYGWRSLSTNETDYSSLTVADSLNRLVTECELRLEPFVFRTIDGRGQLLSQLQGILIGVLEPIRAAGGLYERTDEATGEILDPGYSVDVSPNINTVESLQRNEVRALVAARLSPNAALITLTIVKVGLTAAV